MPIWKSILSVLLLVTACAPAAPITETLDLECALYANTERLLDRGTSHVIILGEMHGTNEAPDALQQLVCAALDAGHPVRVGIETGWTQSQALDDALSPPLNREAMRDAGPAMWGIHDGRSSEAVLSVFQQFSDWRAQGLDIRVFGFDAEPEEWVDAENQSAARDAMMAVQVDNNLQDFEGVVVLLTGAFHARKLAFTFDADEYVPMATKISQRPVLSLEMHFEAGAAWVNAGIMHDDGTYEEKVGPLEMSGNAKDGAIARSIELTPSADGAFDGHFVVGPISPSPPAFPDVPTEA